MAADAMLSPCHAVTVVIVAAVYGHCDAKQGRTVIIGLYEIGILWFGGGKSLRDRAPVP